MAVQRRDAAASAGAAKKTKGQAKRDAAVDRQGVHDRFEERAAILEFDAGMSREDAEYLAGEMESQR